MKYAIAVSSATGNTKMVADALNEAFASGCASVAGAEEVEGELVYEGAIPESAGAVAEADTVLVGFWCDKGSCTDETARFLGELSGKRVFLFGTAGFGGSEEYFDQILGRVRGNLPEGAVYLGGAMCQGKMGPGVRKRYEAMLADSPDDERIKGMIANFDAAASHPDQADLDRIVVAASKAVSRS